jgi:hypothetical protein
MNFFVLSRISTTRFGDIALTKSIPLPHSIQGIDFTVSWWRTDNGSGKIGRMVSTTRVHASTQAARNLWQSQPKVWNHHDCSNQERFTEGLLDSVVVA